jgi:hypothetical protein
LIRAPTWMPSCEVRRDFEYIHGKMLRTIIFLLDCSSK